MIIWIVLAVIFSIAAFLKWYSFRGISQAFPNKKWTKIYKGISLAALLIGFPVMLYSYSGGMMDISPWQSKTIGFMQSFFFCELFLAVIFLLDDFVGLGKWLNNQRASSQKSSANSRRHFIKKIGIGVAALPFANFLYGITKGKYDYRVIRQELTFEDLPEAFDGFTLAQFSDFHAGSFDVFENVAKAFDLLQAQKPDLILFTGDLVNDLQEEAIPYKPLFKSLSAPYGKYSILGNHDYPQNPILFPTKEDGARNLATIKQHHADMDFHLMNNINAKIEKDGAHLRLIGVENWGHGFIQEGDLDKAIIGSEDNEFNILLSHDPTHWEEKVLKHDKHIHLTLSGHTHGSQIGIELMNLKWSPVQYFYKRWAGLYESAKQYLYVNRGFGYIGFSGRVGIPPEITIFTLRKA